MFTRKIKLPMRYQPGTELSTESVLFYQDGGCIQLGREIRLVPGLSKEKLVAFAKDRVTEWILFHHENQTYVTSMKVYSSLASYDKKQLVTCDKFLFTKAIENFLYDTNLCYMEGLESAQMFRLKNALCVNPVFDSDEEEIFYKFDRQAYLDSHIEDLLLTRNPYPMVPVIQDLICKKEVGAEILSDANDDSIRYLEVDPVQAAVQDLTVPIVSYLSNATPVEKSIITQLSPYQYQPKLIQMINTHVNEDATPFHLYKCPFEKNDISRSLRLDTCLYHAIDEIDRDTVDSFSICFDYNKNQWLGEGYLKSSYFHNREKPLNGYGCNLTEAVMDLQKWFNERISTIHICKTTLEEIFIDIELPTGTHAMFYVDIPIFDLMAHNLI